MFSISTLTSASISKRDCFTHTSFAMTLPSLREAWHKRRRNLTNETIRLPRHCEERGTRDVAICTIEFQTKRLLRFTRSDDNFKHLKTNTLKIIFKNLTHKVRCYFFHFR